MARRSTNLTLNYGLRYDYYVPLREADNRIVKFNIDTGETRSGHHAVLQVEEEQLPAATGSHLFGDATHGREGRLRHLRRPGTDGRPDSADRSRADQHDALERIAARVPAQCGHRPGELHGQPEQPIVPAARVRQRVHASGEGLPVHDVGSAGPRRQDLAATVAYVGSQGRNLFLRSVANRTVGVQTQPGTTAALQIREFDIVTCSDGTTRDGTVTALTGSLCGAGLSIASVAEAVRRNRLQDERRPRQLQLDAAGADAAVGVGVWR